MSAEDRQWPALVATNQVGNRLPTLPTVIQNMCGLPASLLIKIIGHVPVWHHTPIRHASRDLQRAYNAYVLHEFRKAQRKSLSEDPKSYKSCALLVIKLATEFYVHAGFESIFCASLMNMMRNTYKDPFCPDLENIKMFLLQFYELTALAVSPRSQRSRLLFSLTLLRFFKHFDEFKILTFDDTMPRQLRIDVQLKGPWFSLMGTAKKTYAKKPELRTDLLVVLANLLICNKTLKSFKDMWACNGQIYVYGNERLEAANITETLLTFLIYGASRICALFRSCFEDEPANLNTPTTWPRDQFTMKMVITCKAATKIGCPLTQSFDLCPFQEYAVEEFEEMEE